LGMRFAELKLGFTSFSSSAGPLRIVLPQYRLKPPPFSLFFTQMCVF